MADDLEIDLERMSLWTREAAVAFFETGEEPAPPWEPEPYLMGRLDKEGLGHLKCEHSLAIAMANLLLTPLAEVSPVLSASVLALASLRLFSMIMHM